MRDNTINLEFGFDIHSQEPIDSRLVLTRYDMEQIGLHDDDPSSKYHTARFPEQYFAVLISSEGRAEQLYVYDRHRLDSESNANAANDDSFIGAFSRVDYEYIEKHPYINGKELVGNLDAEELGLQGKLIAVPGSGIKLTEHLDSEGHTVQDIEVLVDDKIIRFNSDGKLTGVINSGNAIKSVTNSEGLHLDIINDNKTIIIGSEGIEVPIDNETIKLINGKISAIPEGLADGQATQIGFNSEGKELVNVLVDGHTIVIDSNNLKVNHDNTITDSEGLHVNIDGNTIYQTSEGEIKSKVKNAYDSIHEVQGLRSDLQGYLFDTTYSDYNYSDLDKYQAGEFPFGCSSVRSGNFYGRNLDWTYDNKAEFIIRTPRVGSRLATIGIASCTSFTPEAVRAKSYNEKYKIIPLCISDGINEKGVVVNTNVVITEGTSPETSHGLTDDQISIVSSGLTRFILDNFSTAQAAAEFVRDHVSVECSKFVQASGFEQHWMLADKNKTYVIEIKKVGSVVRNVIQEQPAMTNFYITGVTFNSDGTVNTPYTHSAGGASATSQGINLHGCGLERYNLIANGISSSNTKSGMRSLMNSLFYTKAYTLDNVSSPETFWFTESVDKSAGLTVDSDPSAFASAIAADKVKFANRSRDPQSANFGTWHTTHSTVYDLENKKMYICVQEDSTRELEVNFDYYTKDQIDEFLLEHQVDNKTIKRNTDGKAYVPVDNITIFVDSEDGLIKANPESLKDGKATHAYYTSEGYEKVDVLFDNTTIKLNSEGRLYSLSNSLSAGTAIEIDSESNINVLYDNDTIKLNSEGKLEAEVIKYDHKTIILGSEGIETQIGGWKENSSSYTFAEQSGTISNPNPTTLSWSAEFIPEAGKELSVQLKFGTDIPVIEHFVASEVVDNGDGYITAGNITGHTYLDQIRFKKDGTAIEYTFDSSRLAMGTFTSKVFGPAVLYHKIDGKYIPIDNESIKLVNGKLQASASVTYNGGVAISIDSENYINVELDGKTVKSGSEGLYVPVDGITIKYNESTGKIEATGLSVEQGEAIEVINSGYTSEGLPIKKINVKFDHDTITLNSEGKLVSKHEILENGIATEAIYNSEGHEVVNVLFDNNTIKINSEGKLYSTADTLLSGKAIKIDSEGKINVLFDGKTIIINSEGKLTDNIDNETIKYKDGKLKVNVDNITIKYDSTNDWLEATGLSVEAGRAVEVETSGYTSEGTPIKKINVKFDNDTIKLTSEGKLAAAHEILDNGIATEVFYNSEGHEVVNVLFDGTSIQLNSEGKLHAVADALQAGNGIFIDSEGKINSNFDGETIELDSEGKLAVQIDKRALVFDSEGLITVKALTAAEINDILSA